jgi:hypothetical protein
MIPLVAAYGDATPADGLEMDKHYWLTDVASERLNLDDGQVIADSTLVWYQRHSLAKHAATFAACLGNNGHTANENAVGVGI